MTRNVPGSYPKRHSAEEASQSVLPRAVKMHKAFQRIFAHQYRLLLELIQKQNGGIK